jgi:hypothetical protein
LLSQPQTGMKIIGQMFRAALPILTAHGTVRRWA